VISQDRRSSPVFNFVEDSEGVRSDVGCALIDVVGISDVQERCYLVSICSNHHYEDDASGIRKYTLTNTKKYSVKYEGYS
jgi:hypothetical protein